MKLSQIFSAIFFLIILHLTLFISGSTIQRSLSDDIRSGINMAGKILGKIKNKMETLCEFNVKII